MFGCHISEPAGLGYDEPSPRASNTQPPEEVQHTKMDTDCMHACRLGRGAPEGQQSLEGADSEYGCKEGAAQVLFHIAPMTLSEEEEEGERMGMGMGMGMDMESPGLAEDRRAKRFYACTQSSSLGTFAHPPPLSALASPLFVDEQACFADLFRFEESEITGMELSA